LRDIGDARIEIEDVISGATVDSETAVAPPRPGWLVPVLVAGGVLAGIVATLGFGELLFSNAPDPQPTSLSYVPPEGRIVGMPMSTPDGRTLLYWGLDLDPDDSSDVWQVFTRPFGDEEAVAVDGSKNGRAMLMVSPDGDWVAFVARVAPGSSRQKLYKLPLDRSGPTMAIADWPDASPAQNPQWLANGDIAVVTDSPWSVVRIPTDGRPPAAPLRIVTDAPAQRIELVGALPGGGHAIAAIASTQDAGYRQALYLIDFADGKTRLLIENGSMATWSSTGHLVFSRLDQLLAVPFDLDRLETTGGPVTVAEGLWRPRPWKGAWFHLSQSGTLLTMPGGGGGDERTLGFLDRSGGYEPWSDLRLAFQEVAVSPDGTHAAFTIDNITEGHAQWQIRVSSLDRPRLRTLAAIPGQDCQAPVWMPDSAHLIYRCGNESGGTLWLQRADGSEAARMLMEYGADDPVIEVNSVSSDGSTVLLYRQGPGPKVLLKALHGDEEPVDLLPGEETARRAQFSPDGRFIAYSSAETGRREIYLRSYRDGRVGPKILVTTSGGRSPGWSKSPRGEGLELFYLNNKLMWSISLTTEPRLSISEPLVQFEDNESRVETGSMLPDGRFFVILTGEQEEGATRIDVTLDWTARLR
jgi:Tol biopolymer transport system component